MKKLMIVSAFLIASQVHAQSMRMSASSFTGGFEQIQNPANTTVLQNQFNHINPTSNVGTTLSTETTNAHQNLGIVNGGDIRPATGVVVQEDLVAGKKSNEFSFMKNVFDKIKSFHLRKKAK